jgi:uncharacterized protein YecE (DUF72 family)
MSRKLYIGTAGWSLPAAVRDQFAAEGSILTRYASRFAGVEINSSFYRTHRLSTYQRWAESVPEDFRFVVKVPKQITHAQRLQINHVLFQEFMNTCTGLGSKLGGLLVQLPPSLNYDHQIAEDFWALVRDTTDVPVVCEPRHATWFNDAVENQMRHWHIGRVAADPAIETAARETGGDSKVLYYRWHGSPQMYYSAYSASQLQTLQQQVESSQKTSQQIWCIFDNTAAGAATTNALTLQEFLKQKLSKAKPYKA